MEKDFNKIDPKDIPDRTLLKYAIKDIKKYREYSRMLESEIEELKNQLESKEEIISVLKAMTANPELDITELNFDGIKSVTINKLRSKSRNQRKNIDGLLKKNEELKSILSEIEPEIKSRNQEIVKLNKQVELLQRQLLNKDFKGK